MQMFLPRVCFLGMASVQLMGDGFFNQYGWSLKRRIVGSENQELCLLTFTLRCLIISTCRQSDRCHVKGWLEYSGEKPKPSRQMAKNTARPSHHRGLDWIPRSLFYRSYFQVWVFLNLLPLFTEKIKFKTLCIWTKIQIPCSQNHA